MRMHLLQESSGWVTVAGVKHLHPLSIHKVPIKPENCWKNDKVWPRSCNEKALRKKKNQNNKNEIST